MDLRRQLSIARTWSPLVVTCVLLAAIGAFVVSNQLARTYEARVTLIVGQSLSAVNPDYDQLLASQRLTRTYATVATTRPLLDDVIGTLGLATTADDLREQVSADAPLDSTLLTITAQDGSADRAAAIANALAEKLIAASPAIQGRQSEVQQSIEADLKATQAQIRSTQAEVDRIANLASPTPEDVTRLETLRAQLITLRSTYATLLGFSTGSASNLLSVVEPAVPPVEAVSPRPLLNALIAALIAGLLGAGFAALFEYLDDRVRDADTIRAATGLSTLASIPRLRGEAGRKELYALVTLLYPRSAAAEAFRTLRTNLEFASLDAPLRTLVVTSSSPGEGKSVTAANVAVAFAQAGRDVLLVDGDLRKGGLHRIFDLPNGYGLTTLLRRDDVTPRSIELETEQEHLRILTTGPLPPNPAELLGSQRMRIVLDRLLLDHDLVILDSPPLQAVADSAILSAFLDGTLLVVHARRSHRGAVRGAREALAKTGGRVLGAVLNGVPQPAGTTYEHYYGEYAPRGHAPERPAPAPAPEGHASGAVSIAAIGGDGGEHRAS